MSSTSELETTEEKKIEAIREIEDIEGELHEEDHDLASSLSEARIKLNSTLLNEAVGDCREEPSNEIDTAEVLVGILAIVLWLTFVAVLSF